MSMDQMCKKLTPILIGAGAKGKMGFCRVMNFAVVAAFLLALTSCLKQTIDEPADRRLTIAFTPQTLQVTDIDSGYVLLTREGSANPIYMRMTKLPDRLDVDLEDYVAGTWKLEMGVYTKKDTANRSSFYTASLTFIAEHISGILVLAPTGSNSNTVWAKSTVAHSAGNEVVAIIPQDITDPKFTITVLSNDWDEVQVDRMVFRKTGSTEQLINEASWSCTTGCFGSDRILQNTQAFSAFANQNKSNSSWSRARALVSVKSSGQNHTELLSLDWEKD